MGSYSCTRGTTTGPVDVDFGHFLKMAKTSASLLDPRSKRSASSDDLGSSSRGTSSLSPNPTQGSSSSNNNKGDDAMDIHEDGDDEGEHGKKSSLIDAWADSDDEIKRYKLGESDHVETPQNPG